MEPYDAYRMYVALKVHFSSPKYDYIQKNGAIRTSYDKFSTRRDKYYFEKLLKVYRKDEIKWLFIFNFLEKPNFWIGEVFEDGKREKFLEKLGQLQSLKYNFKQDVFYILENHEKVSEAFKVNDGYPWVLIKTFHGRISVESLIILDLILNLFSRWDKKIDDPIVYPEKKKIYLKYKPFLAILIDIKEYKDIFQECLKQY